MATAEENLTRVYTINLGRGWLTPQYRRTDRIVNIIREFAEKHMKSDEVKLDQDLNRQIWSKGKTNPPRNVRVKMTKDEDGVVTVSLYEDLPATEEAPVEEKKAEPEVAETTAAAEEPAPEVKAEEKTETPPK